MFLELRTRPEDLEMKSLQKNKHFKRTNRRLEKQNGEEKKKAGAGCAKLGSEDGGAPP